MIIDPVAIIVGARIEHIAARILDLLDQPRVHAQAARLERAEGAGDFPQRNFLAAEGNGGKGLQRRGDAEAARNADDAFLAGFLRQLRGNRIGRARQGFAQGHGPEEPAAIIFRPPFADGKRGVLEHVIGREPVRQRGGIDKRLEAGARLALGLGHTVEFGFGEVAAAH